MEYKEIGGTLFSKLRKKFSNSAEANQDVPRFSKLNFPQETKDKYTNTNLCTMENFLQDQDRSNSSVLKIISLLDVCQFQLLFFGLSQCFPGGQNDH